MVRVKPFKMFITLLGDLLFVVSGSIGAMKREPQAV
jgi:hypothetical protein